MNDGEFDRLRIPLGDDEGGMGLDDPEAGPAELELAVSTRQLAAGAAIIAALVLLFVRSRRRRDGGPG